MDKKTEGAWIIHHCYKLFNVVLPFQEYEQISFAGKCGIMLNALASSKVKDIEYERVNILAKANGINTKLELPPILEELKKQRLIDTGKSGISILGLTTTSILEHTARIFEEASPTSHEKAALEVSEKVSELPVKKENVLEYVSDIYRLPKKDTEDILTQYEQIGFIDYEDVGDQRLYFNGNLFRRNDMRKIYGILSSLSSDEVRKVSELSNQLKIKACIPKQEAVAILGDNLYSKLCSIGFIDENSIVNENGTFSFITQPAAFSKFTNSIADDAFDLAKAFVTSLTYGMNYSPYKRGRIIMIRELMKKLIDGDWVGPATAIGHDYKILEIKGVVEVKPVGDGRFYMRLLKKDVGQLALMAITEGEASTQSLLQLPPVSAISYRGPEENRVLIRKKQMEPLKKSVAKLLNDLRTGGLG
ncbi:hypothetical protein [Desulfovirgula thermocuniculi]|uniref:hypothetical protein n=1 Tax=Desulfovirgula thermocuniculi TaxID=348842 RepID=UPI0004196850|nr:hypothetical protein [Desulfovirgula thermocuniculi]